MRRSTLLFCFFFFIMPMSCVFFESARCCYLTHSFVLGLNFVSTFWLPFTTLNIWHLLSAGRGGYWEGRKKASITSICFLFKFCIRCQGSWWQGCIKCFCGCKSELMRAEKNGKKSKQRERGKRGRSGGEGRGKKSLRLPAVTRLIYTLAQASQANTTTK